MAKLSTKKNPTNKVLIQTLNSKRKPYTILKRSLLEVLQPQQQVIGMESLGNPTAYLYTYTGLVVQLQLSESQAAVAAAAD
jgi:hypothetical protein